MDLGKHCVTQQPPSFTGQGAGSVSRVVFRLKGMVMGLLGNSFGKRHLRLPEIRSRCFVLLGSVFFFSMVCPIADNGFASGQQTPSTAVSGPVDQSPDYPADFPLLPSCPGGLPVPVAPAKIQDHTPVDAPTIPTAARGLSEGLGKYRNMVLVPGGPFEMGCADGQGRPDERPRHRVNLRSFYMAKCPVTVRDYCGFLNHAGLNSKDGQARVKLDATDCPIVRSGKRFEPKKGLAEKPMVCVSWLGAAEFAEWVGGRLPTEAEWEKAALMSISQPTKDIIGLASGPENETESHGMCTEVGTIWEWCTDWYSRNYYEESQIDSPTGPAAGSEKNIRGGSWISAECSRRIQNRHKAVPRGYYKSVGFRLVRD